MCYLQTEQIKVIDAISALDVDFFSSRLVKSVVDSEYNGVPIVFLFLKNWCDNKNVKNEKKYETIFDLFVANSVNFNIKKELDGMSVLSFLMINGIKKDNIKIIDKLCEVKDFNVNAKDYNGVDVFFNAVRLSVGFLVDSLLKKNCEITDLTVQAICRWGDEDTFFKIKDRFNFVEKINMIDKAGNTLLHKAVQSNSKKIIEELCRYNINPNIKNNNGELAIDLIITQNNTNQKDGAVSVLDALVKYKDFWDLKSSLKIQKTNIKLIKV